MLYSERTQRHSPNDIIHIRKVIDWPYHRKQSYVSIRKRVFHVLEIYAALWPISITQPDSPRLVSDCGFGDLHNMCAVDKLKQGPAFYHLSMECGHCISNWGRCCQPKTCPIGITNCAQRKENYRVTQGGRLRTGNSKRPLQKKLPGANIASSSFLIY